MNNKIVTPLLALISGALLPLSLAPWFWWPVGIACCAALALLLKGAGPWRAYRIAACFGFGMFAVGASWVYVSMNVYGNASVLLSLLLTGLFVTALTLIFALPFILFGALCRNSSLGMVLGFPAAWVLSEWGLSWILTGFPWVYLGYGHLESWLSGWAPLAGVWGISWIVAFSAAALAALIGFGSRPAGYWGALAAALFWLAGWQLQGQQWTSPGQPLSVGLLQPATPQQLRWEPDHLKKILDKTMALNQTLWRNDLIVWPESAIPELEHRVTPLLQKLDQLSRSQQSTLITGIPSYDSEYGRYYNSVIALGNGRGKYHKRHLVPFGEYVPLESTLRGLIDFFDLPMSNFKSGPAQQPPLTANGHTIATAICYEIAYPELVRRLTPGTDILLTVSNDTWFGDSLGPLQHLSMAQMRALENGKPLIRATNDGVSALIDKHGRVTARAPQFEATTLSGEIVPQTGATPFSRLGSWPVLVLCGLGLLAGLIRTRERNPIKL